MRRWWLLLCVALLGGCGGGGGTGPGAPTVAGPVDAEGFWQVVEEVRATAGGDTGSMAAELEARFAGADDETLRSFQEQMVEAHRRLNTWRHVDAAEMICGFVSDDAFADWSSWVVSLGREDYERIAQDPDALADVDDLSGGCEGAGELFGSAVADVHVGRHGVEADFPSVLIAEPPSGERTTDLDRVRASLPRLSARIPDDGLGQPPRTFED